MAKKLEFTTIQPLALKNYGLIKSIKIRLSIRATFV